MPQTTVYPRCVEPRLATMPCIPMSAITFLDDYHFWGLYSQLRGFPTGAQLRPHGV